MPINLTRPWISFRLPSATDEWQPYCHFCLSAILPHDCSFPENCFVSAAGGSTAEDWLPWVLRDDSAELGGCSDDAHLFQSWNYGVFGRFIT